MSGSDKAPDAFRTISEVADELDLPQHVLRFWETRFPNIRPLKRGGGRRYYRPDDVALLSGIRQLLYGEGYTIKGVQRILREQGARAVINAARRPAAAEEEEEAPRPAPPPEDAFAPPGARREPTLGAPVRTEPRFTDPEPDPPDDEELREDLAEAFERGSSEDDEAEEDEAPPARNPYAPPPRASAPPVLRAVPAEPAAQPPAPRPSLGPEGVRRLQAVLNELAECRRLLERG